MNRYELIAFDLDGTLTQHKTPLGPANREVLDRLRAKYRLLMVCAGAAQRVSRQLGAYPVDVIGNYGMQYGVFDAATGGLVLRYDETVPCEREDVTKRIQALRERFGYTQYAGDSVEFHASGCVTFPLLGTAAQPADKLRFDPDRSLRRNMHAAVKEAFPDYTVFVGGSSSFDYAPRPFDKYHALDRVSKELSIPHERILFVGDDYGPGGNDECVFRSDIPTRPIDDYRTLYYILHDLL